jgi:hypothetical protein
MFSTNAERDLLPEPSRIAGEINETNEPNEINREFGQIQVWLTKLHFSQIMSKYLR